MGNIQPKNLLMHTETLMLHNVYETEALNLNTSEITLKSIFKSEALKGSHGKTVQFWARSMDIIQMVLILIRDTSKITYNCISALYALCPMFFAYDHINYTQHVPVYLITLLNLFDTQNFWKTMGLVCDNHPF